MKQPLLSRRTVLRGAGVALALPWLEAFQSRSAFGSQESAERPVRIAALFFPNGVREDRWTPEATGTDWQLTPQLEPLGELKRDLSVVSGLWHQACDTGDGHYVKDAAWLTGTTIYKTTGVNLNSGGISMDQVAAQAFPDRTPLPSMELGIEPVRSGVDGVVGYTRVYGAHIAWRSPTQPLAKEINPRLVFDRMTRVAAGRPTGRSNRPLLDLVDEDGRRLRAALGQADKQRLDQYLESVRSLEQRLERAETSTGTNWKSKIDFSGRQAPPDDPQEHVDRVRLMLDMVALAFESDVTRVITFMFGNSVSTVNYTFLPGVSESHHEASHHAHKPEKLDQYQKISTWHVGQLAYLLQKLKSIPEGDSNVLDNSALLFGSALRDGNKHSPHDLPLLLAGRAGGRLKPGQHVRLANDSPMANLLLTMLHAAGVSNLISPIRPARLIPCLRKISMKAAIAGPGCGVLLGVVCWVTAASGAEPRLEKIDLFQSQQDGYALYRIPGIVVTSRGTVLAYCEARRTGKSDWDTIDIYLRRSTDGGQTFGPRYKIADVPGPKSKNPVALAQKLANPDDVTYNNPVAIVDRNGAVHILFCLEYARCFSLRSDDDGQTFSAPVEITATFDKFRPEYAWKVLATGPAHGIQLKSGRLVVPVWLSTGTGGHAHRPSVTATIFSDDHGQTWHRGDIAVPNTEEWVFPNETVVVELADGQVMLNVRSESKPHRRIIVTSRDGATGWSPPRFDASLLEPICMASIIRHSLQATAGKNRILFANPHNLERADGKAKAGGGRDRKNLSIQLSYDDGQTWPVNKSLEPGYSAYSDLAVLPDGTILCLYERGRASKEVGTKPTSYGFLTFARFNLEWLTDGKDLSASSVVPGSKSNGVR